MDDVKKRMDEIRHKRNPNSIEVYKLVRYLMNVEDYSEEKVLSSLEWSRDTVERAIKKVNLENSRPKPKRYYVSLKEPLEDIY